MSVNSKLVFISRQAGHRFGEHIERVMPLLVRYSSKEDDELREYCLQACEAFVQRCPKEITPHINSVRTCFELFILKLKYIFISLGFIFEKPLSGIKGRNKIVVCTNKCNDKDKRDVWTRKQKKFNNCQI